MNDEQLRETYYRLVELTVGDLLGVKGPGLPARMSPPLLRRIDLDLMKKDHVSHARVVGSVFSVMSIEDEQQCFQ